MGCFEIFTKPNWDVRFVVLELTQGRVFGACLARVIHRTCNVRYESLLGFAKKTVGKISFVTGT